MLVHNRHVNFVSSFLYSLLDAPIYTKPLFSNHKKLVLIILSHFFCCCNLFRVDLN